MSDARSLRKQFNRMLATLLVALAAAGAVTYAWYIYNANRHITDVKMAAGTGVTFLISNEYDGEYKTNAGLSFSGLLDPVSTDNVPNGFQKVTGFTGGTTQDSLFASMFGAAEHSDYYKTSLYLATNSAATDVYLSGIDFTEQDTASPISTALRVGLVTYAPGQGDTVRASTSLRYRASTIPKRATTHSTARMPARTSRITWCSTAPAPMEQRFILTS